MVDGWLALIVVGSMFTGWIIGIIQVCRDWYISDKAKDREIRDLQRAIRYTNRNA